MQRIIKFRGKRLDNGEWVVGGFWKNETVSRVSVYIIDENGNSHSVNPATVGQYTDTKDRNGVEIFECDVVKIVYSENEEQTIEIIEVRDSGRGMGYSPLNWGELCDACDHCVEIESVEVLVVS